MSTAKGGKIMVFRVQKTDNYTVVSNNLIRDTNISTQAMGMMVRILSLPPNWHFSLKGLVAISKEDYYAVRGMILELEKAGYIVRTQEREKSGKWKRIIYDVYEYPQFTGEEIAEESEADAPESRYPIRRQRRKRRNRTHPDSAPIP